jgi:hypothetical protein
MRKILPLFLTALLFPSLVSAVFAQNLDSTNFTLIDPALDSPLVGDVDSTDYSLLFDGDIGAFTTTSSTFRARGGIQTFMEPPIPTISCFETNTNSGSTTCTGLPGADGMFAVCTSLGCYNRAKLELNAQGGAADTRYAIQISTASDFSSNVFYVDATTRFLKASLTIADFIPKCEWEGTTSSGVCGSPNTTWQRHNILGLQHTTTYYVRLSAQKGTATDANFTQTDWSPSVNATTTDPEITVNVDIAVDTVTGSAVPYIVDFGQVATDVVNTATNMIVFKVSSNATSGVDTVIKGLNGGLKHTTLADIMTSVDADLAVASSGFGLRNNSAGNAQNYTSTLGNITISTTPSDFSASGGAHRVGGVGTSFVKLFTSNDLALDGGVAPFYVKAKPAGSFSPGNYSETFTFVVFGTF